MICLYLLTYQTTGEFASPFYYPCAVFSATLATFLPPFSAFLPCSALEGWPLWAASPGLPFLQLLLNPADEKHRWEVVGRGGSSRWGTFPSRAPVARVLSRLCLDHIFSLAPPRLVERLMAFWIPTVSNLGHLNNTSLVFLNFAYTFVNSSFQNLLQKS